jgi:1-acyl-sn-glycerol-3-phosphate acyltransferase
MATTAQNGLKRFRPALDGESEFNKEVHVYVRNHQNWW